MHPSESLEQHFVRARDAVVAARAAPLSLKKAMLALLLVDAAADALAAARGEDDVLRFRHGLAAGAAPLALLFATAAQRPEGPRLVLETVSVPLDDYPGLGIADFMVSLYNRHTVQRVRVAAPDGTRHDVHLLLDQALAALDAQISA